MSGPLAFTKMHGIGNDFVVVDCLTDNGFAEQELQKHSAFLCDRKFGVGSDGVILILPAASAPLLPVPVTEAVDFTMRMFNPDGSEAEMCGNGIRCFAKFVRDRGYTNANSIRVATLGGVKVLQMQGPSEVTVDMGRPGLLRSDLPMIGEAGQAVNQAVDVNGETVRLTAVSMGNPHAVFFTDEASDAQINTLGPLIEKHPLFPRKTNVHAVQVLGPEEVTMLTWERGAGRTLACGTGACAVAVASALNDFTGRRVLCHLPGGDLLIEWREDDRVLMTGPAAEVFTATIGLPV